MTTATVDRSTVRTQAEAHLKALVGNPDATLREDQWTAIEALAVDKRRALVVQQTGWGKSAVYFVATALLRERGAGPTVIISPLLALMRNQIAAADQAGIHAVTINSTNIEDWEKTYEAIRNGQVDVLLVSPERLNNPGFRDQVLPRLAATAGLLVIDEAHCVSDWGHDFRPDYRRIRTMLADLPDGIPVLATTATANARVTADVAEQLSVTGTRTLDNVLVLRGTLDRSTLRLAVLALPSAEHRMAWLADHLNDLDGSGIIYCLTVAQTAEVAEYLRARGHNVQAYSGQTEQTERLAAEEDLINGRVKALVATSALGMGFDAKLGFVINLGAPSSPVAYYQQVGRAGRGTAADAQVILMPGREDRDIWEYFASLSFPPEAEVRQTLDVLGRSEAPMSTQTLETYVPLKRNRLEMMLKVLDVDGAAKRVQGGWTSTGQPWVYDADRYARVARARRIEQQAMLDYQATPGCRMEFLRSNLDDADAAPCGRCDNCGGITVPTDISEAAMSEAHEQVMRPGVIVEPRRMWPTALTNLGLDLKGKIKPEESHEPGRAIARLTDLGYGNDLRDLFRSSTPDGPVPMSLGHALAAVLADWAPGTDGDTPPPDGIIGIDSLSHPTLVRNLATGMAQHTGLPVVGAFTLADPNIGTGHGAANSAQRVAAVSRRYTLNVTDEAVAGRSLFLLDDLTGTGWTLTVLARRLRLAGATAVYPLVLGSET